MNRNLKPFAWADWSAKKISTKFEHLNVVSAGNTCPQNFLLFPPAGHSIYMHYRIHTNKINHGYQLQCGMQNLVIGSVCLFGSNIIRNNNLETSYFTQLKMLPNDTVSMSVGHLDHVLIVYSSMKQVTWSIVSLARTAPALLLKRQAGSLVWGSRNTRKKWTLSQLVHRPEPAWQMRAV